MALLRRLYKEQPAGTQSAVDAFIRSPKNISQETDSLQQILADPSFEKAEALFVIEILAQTLHKKQDFTKFTSVILDYSETNLSYKNSIFLLRILSPLINTKFFIPVAFYLVRVIEEAVKTARVSSTGKQYDYDCVRLSSDDLVSEELQCFVIGEAAGLLKRHCLSFGSSIGFPEYAFVLCNELRSRCKTGPFKPLMSELIKCIADRKEYIEAEREARKMRVLDTGTVCEFERQLEPWTAL